MILELSFIQDGVSCIGQIASSLSKTGPVKPYGGLDLDQHCLMAPSHYLNQCCLLISEVLWHSPKNQATILYNKFEKYIVINAVISPNSQCVDICLIGPLATTYSEMWIKLNEILQEKCIWNCRLQNIRHFSYVDIYQDVSVSYILIPLELEIPEMITNFKPNRSLGTTRSWWLSSLFLSHWTMPHRRKTVFRLGT